jgi:hypothetical protein
MQRVQLLIEKESMLSSEFQAFLAGQGQIERPGNMDRYFPVMTRFSLQHRSVTM